MADRTEIAWCDSTFNPWIGCTKVGPGCDHCYAEADFDLRKHRAKWGPGNPRSRTSPANWRKPLQWNARPFYECGCGYRGTMDELTTNAIHRCGEQFKRVRRRVFCASLADVFDNDVPDEWRADLITLIEKTPNLDWLILTKRIGNVTRMIEEATDLIDYGEGWQSMWGQGKWPDHVKLGATICNQEEADRDISKLLAVPAGGRWLSMEPLLGPVSFRWASWHDYSSRQPGFSHGHLDGLRGIDWVVVGGESGPNARPMHPDWARSLRDQCAAAGVPYLFKQWGEWLPGRQRGVGQEPEGFDALPVHKFDAIDHSWKVGKKAAGRLLDGKLHDSHPEDRP